MNAEEAAKQEPIVARLMERVTEVFTAMDRHTPEDGAEAMRIVAAEYNARGEEYVIVINEISTDADEDDEPGEVTIASGAFELQKRTRN